MPVSSAIQGTCDDCFARVREIFAEQFGDPAEVGAGLCVTLDGRAVVDLWAGHADAARTRPWTPDTIVNLFSTTKGMVSLCAHRLVDQGRLDLDAPVARYWPEFAQADKGVCDPEPKLGFGYAMNRMEMGMSLIGSRATALMRATYESL